MHTLNQHDIESTIQLLLTYRQRGFVHQYPTLWRLRLLLDSRVWDFAQHTRAWKHTNGQLLGAGVLWKRREDSTSYGLERIIHPHESTNQMMAEMLSWAKACVDDESKRKQVEINISTMPLEQDSEHDIVLLTNNGFHKYTEGHNVYMAMPLVDDAYPVSVPHGFQLGALQEADLEDYQSAYGFASVNMTHLKATLDDPEYQHFVIKSSDNTFVAYVECSYSKQEWKNSNPRIGWIDYIQTMPDFQSQGLGMALMHRAFNHFTSVGIQNAYLITSSENHPAQALFGKAGMQATYREFPYVYQVDGSQ